MMKCKKLFSTVFFIVNSIVINAQPCEGYYVKNNGDTVQCKVVMKRLFIINDIDLASYHHKVKIIENDKRIKFKPKEIKSFSFQTPENQTFTFVSFAKKKKFLHEIIKGKISLYNSYSGFLIDGPLIYTYAIKEGQTIRIWTFSSRKKVGALIDDYPQLFNEWMEDDTYFGFELEDAIKRYNEYFLDK